MLFLLFPVVPVLLNENLDFHKIALFGPIKQQLEVASQMVVVREFHLFGDKSTIDKLTIGFQSVGVGSLQ